MAFPTLLSFEEEVQKMNALQEENESLKKQVAGLQVADKQDTANVFEEDNIRAVPRGTELMDDFSVIAQESPQVESQSKSIKSLIRNIGLPTSPILGRKPSSNNNNGAFRKQEDTGQLARPVYAVKPKPRAPSCPPPQSCTIPGSSRRPRLAEHEHQRAANLSSSLKEQHPFGTRSVVSNDEGATSGQKGQLLLLSQEKYKEHNSCITHCRFNSSGSMVASSDMDGIIKIWTPSPSPRTVATVMPNSSVLALEWYSKRERLLLHGSRSGSLKLYDTRERRNVWDASGDPNCPVKDQRIICIACSPTESCFVCSTSTSTSRSAVVPGNTSVPENGKLLLWDMRTMQFQCQLPMENGRNLINCCVFNHNGQLLLAGLANGQLKLYDMRSNECIASWTAHRGEVLSQQFSSDETSCYSMGKDGKFFQWSINQTGEKIAELNTHPGAAKPATLTGQASSQYHRPVGKLFACDGNGQHVLTCGASGGIVYKLSETDPLVPVLNLGGHKWPVVTVDWSTAMDCTCCVTASLEGRILVSTLLTQ